MDFRYSEQYDGLNSEAHRSPAQPCGAPALTRHIAFWPTPDKTKYSSVSEATSAFENRRWTWFKQIDELAKDFLDKIPDADYRGPLEKEETRFITNATWQELAKKSSLSFRIDRSSLYFNFAWLGHLVKVQILPHNEYATITIVVDLSKGSKSYNGSDTISQKFRALRSLFDGTPQNESDRVDLAKFFYEDVWRDFDECFSLALSPRTQGTTTEIPDNAKDAGSEINAKDVGSEIFADFRGLVLYSGQEDQLHSVEASTGEPRTGSGEVIAFDAATEAICLKRIWPIVEAASGGQAVVRELEFTACSMLDRRAIYISSLGSRPISAKGTISPPVNLPVRYTLAINGFSGGFDRWQLGRLVHRIHTLGTLRLIALRDFKTIRLANPNVMILGRRLDEIYREHLNAPTNTKKFSTDLNEFFYELSRLGNDVPYGIAYRINRSRYFSHTFRTILQDLRIERIPGWQPYDEFVRRRLFSVYNSIDMIGHRLDALRLRANTLLDVLNTSQLVEYQRLADLIIIPAFTYYVGSMLGYLNKAFGIGNFLGFTPDGSQVFSYLFALGLGLLLRFRKS